MAGNEALTVNPDRYSQYGITTRASDWLWAVFAVMLVTDLVVLAWHFTIPRGQRLFHQLGAIILTTAAISYFSMASNLGSTPIATEFAYSGYPIGTLRQIWYVRYIDWVITTPALLLELTLASGLPLSDIVTLMFFDLVMIITGLVGALVASSYKWGYYTFGCLALFYLWWVLLGPARTSAGALGADFKRSFTVSTAILAFLWLLYPIAWGLADGGSVIHPDGEMIFYGILDLLAKPVFLLVHLFQLSKLDLTRLQLQSGKMSIGAGAIGPYTHDAEKAAVRNAGLVAVDNQPRTPVMGSYGAHPSPAANSTATGAKKGMFSRKGKYDVTNATNDTATHHTGEAPIGLAQPVHASEAAPRHSTATVVSR